MAKYVITDPEITVNSVDLSDHISSVTITESYADVQDTGFGSTAHTRQGGLGDHSISLTFQDDFGASSVHATIYPLLNTTTAVTVKPVNTTTSTTNPSFSMTVLVNDWPTIAGSIGDLATADITWPVSGGITKATS